MANQPRRGFFSRVFRRNQPQMVVPSANNLRNAVSKYINAANKTQASNRNISAVKAAFNKLINVGKNVAAKPYAASNNYGLAAAYSNLRSAINRLNKNVLSKAVNKANVSINAASKSTPMTANVKKMSNNVRRELAKARAITNASGGLFQAIQSFMIISKQANKTNANYVNRLNMAYNQLKNLQPIFKNNYNKARGLGPLPAATGSMVGGAALPSSGAETALPANVVAGNGFAFKKGNKPNNSGRNLWYPAVKNTASGNWVISNANSPHFKNNKGNFVPVGPAAV